jgi:hypothetical protein
MPSKRHGYMTRKEWLRMRLELARDKAGAFDVERLLRFVATIHAPVSANGLTYNMTSPDVCLSYDYAEVEARMSAMAKIPTFPTHWTDEQRRQYLTTGFVVEVGEAEEADKFFRKSPPVTVYVAGLDCGPLDREPDIEIDIE